MATPIGDNVVVVDYDDDFFKAGYCIPERDPQVVLPTAVRRPGDGAETFRPIASRRVQDWDQLESLYAHAFYRQLGWVEGDEGAVLVSEPLFTSRADRERLAQTLFESFNVSGLYVAEQPVLALYGLGKTSGVSVDVGYAVTDVAPVVDGAVAPPPPGERTWASGTSPPRWAACSGRRARASPRRGSTPRATPRASWTPARASV